MRGIAEPKTGVYSKYESRGDMETTSNSEENLLTPNPPYTIHRLEPVTTSGHARLRICSPSVRGRTQAYGCGGGLVFFFHQDFVFRDRVLEGTSGWYCVCSR